MAISKGLLPQTAPDDRVPNRLEHFALIGQPRMACFSHIGLRRGQQINMSHSSKKTTVERQYKYKAFVLFLVGYGILIVWFHYIDHYHSAFDARGLSVVAYNVIRIASVFYLFAIIYGTGSFVLRAIFSNEFLSLSPTKNMAMGFLAGAGIWHVAMLILG